MARGTPGAAGRVATAGKAGGSGTAAKPTTKQRVARRTRAKVAGRVVPDSKLRATPLPRPSGDLYLVSVGTHDSLKANIYNDDGSFSTTAGDQIARVLRCKRTGEVRPIEPRLLTLLSHVYDHFDGRQIEVVSGYRNQRRTTSNHFKGAATDIRVAGVKPAKLRAFLETLDEGGLGIGTYPRTGFIHLDVRPPPSYRWIDWSRAEPNSPDKRPPRGWKKKKLQS